MGDLKRKVAKEKNHCIVPVSVVPPIIPPMDWNRLQIRDETFKFIFMDFEQYWTLIGGDTHFADRKEAAHRAWLANPDKQQHIIKWLQTHGRYPGRNPYFFILDFQIKNMVKTLSYADYYARYGTTEPRDGWQMANPTGNCVIYVKS